MIRPELLEILVCPETHAPLVVDRQRNLVSTDPKSRRCYRVEDGIPVLLIDESRVLSPEDHADALEWARNHPVKKKSKA
ncbi:Trm112 family protein [Candidatus Poribacteria bacterium]|nr:Trm112 family protein [Candidatus Poribacteria bacterium]